MWHRKLLVLHRCVFPPPPSRRLGGSPRLAEAPVRGWLVARKLPRYPSNLIMLMNRGLSEDIRHLAAPGPNPKESCRVARGLREVRARMCPRRTCAER